MRTHDPPVGLVGGEFVRLVGDQPPAAGFEGQDGRLVDVDRSAGEHVVARTDLDPVLDGLIESGGRERGSHKQCGRNEKGKAGHVSIVIPSEPGGVEERLNGTGLYTIDECRESTRAKRLAGSASESISR